ncbi:hypothetical protein [Weissella halotolerans]|uniref:Uncharacterized protein n=1 Tax=Weissella halotolerans DSM 20190 TaxID=1123500 RepID=A0A0R2G8U0_9LACO|nr:hypothetical protein [Weissella halotolerans]KRN33626.1 hypothetical protein IV68_GL000433 [Weissella halotolerans DSM 20190]
MMALTGTKAWAKQRLQENGVRQILVNKRPRRLQNVKTQDLYRQLQLMGLLEK